MKHIRKKYVTNLKTFPKHISKINFIKNATILKENLKKENILTDDLTKLENMLKEDVLACSEEFKHVFKKYTLPICNKVDRSHYFRNHQDFLQFNRIKLKKNVYSRTKIRI